MRAFSAEAVNEVKRKAIAELQKAVAESEAKASHLVASERAKMEAALAEARKQAMEEILISLNSQQESTEVCSVYMQSFRIRWHLLSFCIPF